jgi:hypothetical protein
MSKQNFTLSTKFGFSPSFRGLAIVCKAVDDFLIDYKYGQHITF